MYRIFLLLIGAAYLFLSNSSLVVAQESYECRCSYRFAGEQITQGESACEFDVQWAGLSDCTGQNASGELGSGVIPVRATGADLVQLLSGLDFTGCAAAPQAFPNDAYISPTVPLNLISGGSCQNLDDRHLFIPSTGSNGYDVFLSHAQTELNYRGSGGECYVDRQVDQNRQLLTSDGSVVYDQYNFSRNFPFTLGQSKTFSELFALASDSVDIGETMSFQGCGPISSRSSYAGVSTASALTFTPSEGERCPSGGQGFVTVSNFTVPSAAGFGGGERVSGDVIFEITNCQEILGSRTVGFVGNTSTEWSLPAERFGLNKLAGLSGGEDVPKLAGRALSWLLSILGIIALGMYLYAGILWMFEGIKPGGKETALKIFLWTSIGIVAFLSLYTAVNFVMSVFV